MAATSSNKTTFWIIGILVVVVLLGGVGYKVVKHEQNLAMQQSTQGNGPVVSPTASPMTGSGNPSNQSGSSLSAGNSNQDLNSDLNSVQGSMNQLQQDQNTSAQDTSNASQDVPQQ